MPMIAKGADELYLLPGMVNRHGLVAGATGTGKTVTLQVMTSGGGDAAGGSGAGWRGGLEAAGTALGGVLGSGGGRRGDTVVQAMVKRAARRMGSTGGRQLIRGVLGSLLGGSKR